MFDYVERNCKVQYCQFQYGTIAQTYEPCCDMLGIDYEPNNWNEMVSHHDRGLIPTCDENNQGCGPTDIFEKCDDLEYAWFSLKPGEHCEPVCEVKVKPAGWGRARSPGFDRISLENVMCREGNTATWQLWLAILALYLGHWAAYRIVDAHDEEATETIRAAAEDAPPHHYAVATTGLPEHLREPAALEAFFEGVFERPGAVVRVVPCRHLSAATRGWRRSRAARRRRRRETTRPRRPPATRWRPPTRPPRTSSSSRPPARRRRPSRRPRRAASP